MWFPLLRSTRNDQWIVVLGLSCRCMVLWCHSLRHGCWLPTLWR